MDMERRIAILESKFLMESSEPLPAGVARTIAEFLPVADADELEGALIRIVAYADLTNQPISESLAIEVMDPGRTRP